MTLITSKGEIEGVVVLSYTQLMNCKSDTYQIGPDPKTTIMVWACDAKGIDPHNKKHVEYDGDGNTTQRTSKYVMAWQTEKWHAHLWHQPRDGHWQRTLGCHGEKRRHHLDGRRRKRLVVDFHFKSNGKNNIWSIVILFKGKQLLFDHYYWFRSKHSPEFAALELIDRIITDTWITMNHQLIAMLIFPKPLIQLTTQS